MKMKLLLSMAFLNVVAFQAYASETKSQETMSLQAEHTARMARIEARMARMKELQAALTERINEAEKEAARISAARPVAKPVQSKALAESAEGRRLREKRQSAQQGLDKALTDAIKLLQKTEPKELTLPTEEQSLSSSAKARRLDKALAEAQELVTPAKPK